MSVSKHENSSFGHPTLFNVKLKFYTSFLLLSAIIIRRCEIQFLFSPIALLKSRWMQNREATSSLHLSNLSYTVTASSA